MQSATALIEGGWEAYHRLLVAAIAPLDATQLDLQPAPHLWSVRTTANHIVAVRAWWFHSWMQEGGPELARYVDFDEEEGSARRSAADILEGLEATWALLDSALRRWSATDLDQKFQRPAPNPAGEWESRRWITWHVAEHDVHHGGEISITLGMHGLPAINV
jgi:uncharacterized damage-inducible protein DinB